MSGKIVRWTPEVQTAVLGGKSWDHEPQPLRPRATAISPATDQIAFRPGRLGLDGVGRMWMGNSCR